MVMLSDEVSNIKDSSSSQRYKLLRLLEERVVPEHMAHHMLEGLVTGDLSQQEMRRAIALVDKLPEKGH